MRKAGVVLLVTTLLLVLVSTSVSAGGVIKISADVGGELFLALSDKVEVGAGYAYLGDDLLDTHMLGFTYKF